MVMPIMLIWTIYIDSELIVGAGVKYTQSFGGNMTERMRARVMALKTVFSFQNAYLSRKRHVGPHTPLKVCYSSAQIIQ